MTLQETADGLEVFADLVGQGKLKDESLAAVRSLMYRAKMEAGEGYVYRGLQQVVRMLRTVDSLEKTTISRERASPG